MGGEVDPVADVDADRAGGGDVGSLAMSPMLRGIMFGNGEAHLAFWKFLFAVYVVFSFVLIGIGTALRLVADHFAWRPR